MANFFGTVRGQRGMATRLGHRNITTQAASWSGAVEVTVGPAQSGKSAHAHVRLIPWRGAGISRVLYDGPVDQPAASQRQYVVRVCKPHSPVTEHIIGPFESHDDAREFMNRDDMARPGDWYIEPLTLPSLEVRQDLAL